MRRCADNKFGVLTLVALLPCAAVYAEEPPRLVHNPFARPPSEVTVFARPSVTTNGSIRELDLRVTMVASNSKLANVAGRTVRPGDEVQGYTLLQIYEDRAVFIRDGRRLTIYVKPDPEEDDE
jgi:hypothetical protein